MLYDALKRLSKHSLIYAIAPTLNKAAGFFLIPVVTYNIGSTGNYGVKELAEVTLLIMGQFLGINLLTGMTRYYRSYDEADDRARLVSTTLFLVGAGVGLALIAGLILAGPLALLMYRGEQFSPVVRAVVVILFFQLLGQVGLHYLRLHERSAIFGALILTKTILEVVFKVIFLVALGLEVMGVLYSVMVGEILLGTGMCILVLVKCGLRFSWPMAKRLVRFSLPLIATGLCMFVLHQADRFIVLRFHGRAEVGLYGLAYKFGSMVNALFLASFILIWFPYIFSVKDDEEVRILCRKITTYFVLVTTVASLFVALFSPEIVGLMAEKDYFAAHRAVPIVLAGYIFWAAFHLIHTVFYLKERTIRLSILVGVAAAFNLGMNFLLVPGFGFFGAAWVTLLTFFFLALTTWLAAERVFPVSYEVRRIALPIGLGAALYLASLGIPHGWPLLGVVLIKTALLVLFPVILLVGGYLTDQERTKIRAIFRLLRRGLRKTLRAV
jgi:O-antigen/teichoic acid export membrane protein